ncbi:MAG: PAS-domain containing protein [Alphaproteobacteria bacterium]|nr:PAS-domain containing protein [Alphaproteobacteria bacterium]
MGKAVLKTSPQRGFFARLGQALLGPPPGPRRAPELARLEAFLDAFPGEYCGFTRDGSVAYSAGFCALLGLQSVRGLGDIQARLNATDSAALEAAFDTLRRTGKPFRLALSIRGSQQKITFWGAQGQDLHKTDKTTVLWAQPQQEEEFAAPKAQPYEAALNAIPRPVWLRDAQQNLIWVNQTYADFLNTDPKTVIAQQKELSTKSAKQGPDNDDRQPGRSLAARAYQSGQMQEARAHAIVKGARLLIRLTEMPMPTQNSTLGIGYNITREEELESNLRRYQASSHELLAQLRSAIGIYSQDQRLEFYNPAFAQLWGLEEGWLNTGPKLGEIIEKLRETRRLPEQSDFRRYKQSWLDMFTRLIEAHEDLLHLPDGTTLRMLVVPHSMGGLMMTFEDVTSRLALESSYNTLIAVQKETLDNLGEAVAAYGGDGRLKLWNPAFSRLWHLNPEDLEGEPHITTLADKMRKRFIPQDWAARRDELIAQALERRMHEGRLQQIDGTLLDYSTVPLPDGGVLITTSDVTDSVRVENALREKNAALEAAERLKLDFLANVSYQLRTPLNAIMGFNEILQQEFFGPLNPKQKEYTVGTQEASERLLGLINDILDLASLEAGTMVLERQEFKIYGMLKAVQELMEPWAQKEQIHIIFKCAKTIGKFTGDESRIKQAVVNLVRNSLNFTPAGGTITLAAELRQDGLEISITDTGIGIPPEDRRRIFEPFERARAGGLNEGARVSRAGAGLGLSLVRSIVMMHGGTVDLESAPGKGTKVTLFLPSLSIKTDLRVPVGGH